MDKLTAIKIKYDDGTYSDEIPVSVLSENVEWDNTHTLVDVLGSIDVDVTGTLQDQISRLFNEKINYAAMQEYVSDNMNTYITNWLNTNVNPVGSAVSIDKSLTVEGMAADAKETGYQINNNFPIKVSMSNYNYFFDTGNLFNKDDSENVIGKFIYPSTGDLSNNKDFWASNYIIIYGLETISMTSVFSYAIYNANKEYIQGSQSSPSSLELPDNAFYIRISGRNTTIADTQLTIDKKVQKVNFREYLYIKNLLNLNPINETLSILLNAISYGNLFNKNDNNNIYNRYLSPSSGQPMASGGELYYVSHFINIKGLSSLDIRARFYAFYTEQYNYIIGAQSSGQVTVEVPSNATYLRISALTANIDSNYAGYNVSRCINKEYLGAVLINNLEFNNQKEIDDTIEQVSTLGIDYINRFNPNTITDNSYMNVSTGGVSSYDGFFASDFIYIGDLSSITISKTHITCWYDENKNFLGSPSENRDSRSLDKVIPLEDNVAYLRFSSYYSNLETAQIGEKISRSNYIPYGKYTLKNYVNKQSIIIVDANGNGDYSSFTQAVKENLDNGIKIYVNPGTYDIRQEYNNIFGKENVDNMADSDTEIFQGFQYGVRLLNREIEFAPGAKLICDCSDMTINGTHRFCPLRVEYDVKIIGLDLETTHTFYGIHDDYGLSNMPYTVEYQNCRVIAHNLTNVNCIGGGCKKYSRHIINNCYFDNGSTSSTVVRYHNTSAEGAVPEIYISNTYFATYFYACWYGPQTSKMRVYVNNCKAKKIDKRAESSSYDVDNIELYKWNNEEDE